MEESKQKKKQKKSKKKSKKKEQTHIKKNKCTSSTMSGWVFNG
jgi:hypothetical protein